VHPLGWAFSVVAVVCKPLEVQHATPLTEFSGNSEADLEVQLLGGELVACPSPCAAAVEASFCSPPFTECREDLKLAPSTPDDRQGLQLLSKGASGWSSSST